MFQSIYIEDAVAVGSLGVTQSLLSLWKETAVDEATNTHQALPPEGNPRSV